MKLITNLIHASKNALKLFFGSKGLWPNIFIIDFKSKVYFNKSSSLIFWIKSFFSRTISLHL